MKRNILNSLIVITMISIIIPSTIYGVDLIRDNVKKTVSDISTNLMWQDDYNATQKKWSDAITYCEDLTLGEYIDWRLPNRFELVSLVDYSKSSPAIKENVFQFTTFTTSNYISSTSLVTDSARVWYVDFGSGNTGYNEKSFLYYVRCVRNKQ